MKLGLLGLKSYNLEICSYILIYFKLLLSLISSKQFLPVEGFHTLGWSTVTALAAVCCRTDGFYAILLSRFSNILLLHSVQFCPFFLTGIPIGIVQEFGCHLFLLQQELLKMTSHLLTNVVL